MLVLPYKGERGQIIIKSINKAVKKILPQNHLIQNVYKGRKLGSYFKYKRFHKSRTSTWPYQLPKCPEVNCNETYLGETARRLQKRILDDSGKDRKSNMVKHNMDTGYPLVCMKDFQILTNGFNQCKFKRKICPALLIKKHWPTLNAQKHSVTLELFEIDFIIDFIFFPWFFSIETSLSIYFIIWWIVFCMVKSLTDRRFI